MSRINFKILVLNNRVEGYPSGKAKKMINLSVKEVEKKAAIVDAKGVPMVDYDSIDHGPFLLRDELLEGMFPDDNVFYDISDGTVEKE